MHANFELYEVLAALMSALELSTCSTELEQLYAVF
jgi:hypothetical protein